MPPKCRISGQSGWMDVQHNQNSNLGFVGSFTKKYHSLKKRTWQICRILMPPPPTPPLLIKVWPILTVKVKPHKSITIKVPCLWLFYSMLPFRCQKLLHRKEILLYTRSFLDFQINCALKEKKNEKAAESLNYYTGLIFLVISEGDSTGDPHGGQVNVLRRCTVDSFT